MKPERENIELQISHPNFGSVLKTVDGRIVCHICGKAYRKLGAHIVQTHNRTSYEYKIAYGLDVSKGLITDDHKAHLSECARSNYDVVIKQNLVEKGEATRYVANGKGRTRNLMSEQTKRALVERGRETIKNTKFHKMHEENIHKGK